MKSEGSGNVGMSPSHEGTVGMKPWHEALACCQKNVRDDLRNVGQAVPDLTWPCRKNNNNNPNYNNNNQNGNRGRGFNQGQGGRRPKRQEGEAQNAHGADQNRNQR